VQQAAPSLQHEVIAFVMLHLVMDGFVSAVAYTTPASPRISVTTIALKYFMIVSPVDLKSFSQTCRYTTGLSVLILLYESLNQEYTAAQVGSTSIMRQWIVN